MAYAVNIFFYSIYSKSTRQFLQAAWTWCRPTVLYF